MAIKFVFDVSGIYPMQNAERLNFFDKIIRFEIQELNL